MSRKLTIAGALAATALLAACGGQGVRVQADPPGDGSVRCPGNAACPDKIQSLVRPVGIAGPEVADFNQKKRQLICTGDPGTSDAGCPDGYVGRLLLKEALVADNLQEPVICRNGQGDCKPQSWAIICPEGKGGCPMLPGK